jgi:hypothetical protein
MKKIIGAIGLFLCALSLLFFGKFLLAEKKALSLDAKKTAFAEIIDEYPPCQWEVTAPDRVLSEDKSQAITVKTSNHMDGACRSTISLHAPGFDISPSKEDQQTVLPVKQSGSLSWILTPRKTGTFEISVSDIINTKIFGITVTNTFGLSSFQAKIASIIGSIFGPMLTIPWWWERLLNRKKPKQPEQQTNTV